MVSTAESWTHTSEFEVCDAHYPQGLRPHVACGLCRLTSITLPYMQDVLSEKTVTRKLWKKKTRTKTYAPGERRTERQVERQHDQLELKTMADGSALDTRTDQPRRVENDVKMRTVTHVEEDMSQFTTRGTTTNVVNGKVTKSSNIRTDGKYRTSTEYDTSTSVVEGGSTGPDFKITTDERTDDFGRSVATPSSDDLMSSASWRAHATTQPSGIRTCLRMEIPNLALSRHWTCV